jgi:hypothetical protein
MSGPDPERVCFGRKKKKKRRTTTLKEETKQLLSALVRCIGRMKEEVTRED